MCNLSQGVYEKGVKEGFGQGLSQGISSSVAILWRCRYQDGEIVEQIMQEYQLTQNEAEQKGHANTQEILEKEAG